MDEKCRWLLSLAVHARDVQDGRFGADNDSGAPAPSFVGSVYGALARLARPVRSCAPLGLRALPAHHRFGGGQRPLPPLQQARQGGAMSIDTVVTEYRQEAGPTQGC